MDGKAVAAELLAPDVLQLGDQTQMGQMEQIDKSMQVHINIYIIIYYIVSYSYVVLCIDSPCVFYLNGIHDMS